jgi:chitin disaccharide deacetylase
MDSRKSLIVNADDFGYSRGVNRGIVEAHEHGVVTSASLMVDRPAAQEAAGYSRSRPKLSLGLHFELPAWRVRGAIWGLFGKRDDRLARAVAAELRRQLEHFRRMVGSDPTHLDSHKHRHREEPLRSVCLEVADELNVPLRHFDPALRFCGNFYGQIGAGRPNPEAISPRALVELLEGLEGGVTELCCHPGYADGLKAWYHRERVEEVRTLCDQGVRAAIDGLRIRLISFHELPSQSGSRAFSSRDALGADGAREGAVAPFEAAEAAHPT